MRLRLLVLVAVLCAACGTDKTSSQPQPSPLVLAEPKWTGVPAQGIPADSLTDIFGATAWSDGLVLAGQHWVPAEPNARGIVNRAVPDLFISATGDQWHQLSLPGLTRTARDNTVTTDQHSIYVLGATDGPATVWKSSDENTSTLAALPGTYPGEALCGIASGPDGVVVVAFDQPRPGIDTERIQRVEFDGLRVWHSADGMTFSPPTTIAIPSLIDAYPPKLVANQHGFAIYGMRSVRSQSLLLTSVDGEHWRDASQNLPGPLRALVANGTRTVGLIDDSPDGPAIWTQSDAESTWTRSDAPGVGQLPDLGVGPRNEQNITSIVPWQQGFLAAGDAGGYAAVWLSPDGIRWVKIPVKANGFPQGSFRAVNNSNAPLLVHQSETQAPIRIWRANR